MNIGIVLSDGRGGNLASSSSSDDQVQIILNERDAGDVINIDAGDLINIIDQDEMTKCVSSDDVMRRVIPSMYEGGLSPMAVQFIVVGVLFAAVVILGLINMWINYHEKNRSRGQSGKKFNMGGRRLGDRPGNKASAGQTKQSRRLFMRPAHNLSRFR